VVKLEQNFDIVIDLEDIFNSIIKNNPDITPEQRVEVWQYINDAWDKIIEESERAQCLNV